MVSDEWDDPDSKRKPVNEWMPHLERAGIYDTHYQRAMVNRYRELMASERFHLIARFHKGNRPGRNAGSKSYLRVAWYAIGEKPKAVELPPPPAVRKPEDPPPPPKPQPPSFGRGLTLLGGLIPAHEAGDSARPDTARIKVLNHAEPFVAWQVDGVTASGVDSQFEVSIHKWEETGALQTVQRLKSVQLARTSEGRLRGLTAGTLTQPLPDGVYRVTIEEKPASGAAAANVLPPVATWIEVNTPANWLPWLLGASLLGAAGVIGLSVWSLRR